MAVAASDPSPEPARKHLVCECLLLLWKSRVERWRIHTKGNAVTWGYSLLIFAEVGGHPFGSQVAPVC